MISSKLNYSYLIEILKTICVQKKKKKNEHKLV